MIYGCGVCHDCGRAHVSCAGGGGLMGFQCIARENHLRASNALDHWNHGYCVNGGGEHIRQQSCDMADGLRLGLIAVVFDGRNGDRIGQRETDELDTILPKGWGQRCHKGPARRWDF